MIPPEPEPTIPEYTYYSSSPISLGSVTGTLYTDIQDNGVDCELTSKDSDNRTRHYSHLILYEVDGVDYCYFVRGTSSAYYGILGNNSGIGLTIPVYTISNGSVTQYGTENLEASVPSDYYDTIKSGNFTLVQRS